MNESVLQFVMCVGNNNPVRLDNADRVLIQFFDMFQKAQYDRRQ